MIIVGIDPGLSGAVVALDRDEVLLGWWDTPTIQLAKGKAKRDYAVAAMRDLLDEVGDHSDRCAFYIETQQAMPKQGVSSTFKTGRGFGLWEGLVAARRRFTYELVRPAAWQRAILSGVSGEGKARSLTKSSQMFPDLPLTKPKGRVPCMDGRADAALIALWGVRRRIGALCN